MMTGMGVGFGFIGLVFMFLFWGGLIAVAVLLIRAVFPNSKQSPPVERESSAGEILDRRYARGEITREQYQAMKQDL